LSDCLLCGSGGCAEIYVRHKGYWHCTRCDLIQLGTQWYLDAAAERRRYEEHNNSIEDEGYVAFLADFVEEAVLPVVQKGETALDYGCGPAPVLQALLEKKGIVTDVYDPFFFPVQPQHTYDLVTCTEALEHAFEPKDIWAKLISFLKPEGHLAMMTRFHPGIREFPQWWYRRDPTHVSFYSPTTFDWIAANYPLELVKMNKKDKVVYKRR
jgi:SAM-dependent methyltransferase